MNMFFNNNHLMTLCSARKILTCDQLIETRQRLKQLGQRIVFTNGCFDIIHAGHVTLLDEARRLGDRLIVGLNSDASVKRLKGPRRPIFNQTDRALVISSMETVDYVVIFDDDEPASLIEKLLPDVLVKGSDWGHYVSGRDIVERNGGKVVLLSLVTGHSSTAALNRIAAANNQPDSNREP